MRMRPCVVRKKATPFPPSRTDGPPGACDGPPNPREDRSPNDACPPSPPGQTGPFHYNSIATGEKLSSVPSASCTFVARDVWGCARGRWRGTLGMAQCRGVTRKRAFVCGRTKPAREVPMGMPPRAHSPVTVLPIPGRYCCWAQRAQSVTTAQRGRMRPHATARLGMYPTVSELGVRTQDFLVGFRSTEVCVRRCVLCPQRHQIACDNAVISEQRQQQQ